MRLIQNKNYNRKPPEEINFDGFIFKDIFLQFCEIKNRSFINCSFVNVDFGETDIINCNFENSNFSNCILKHTNFKNCLLKDIKGSDFDLRSGSLVENNFQNCNFFNSSSNSSVLSPNSLSIFSFFLTPLIFPIIEFCKE